MKYYIAIDGGTTNTRVMLVRNGEIVRRIRVSAGAGRTPREEMKVLLREAVSSLLRDENIMESNLTAILASGMITSEKGLAEIPHITVPAGTKELHDALTKVTVPEIASIPIYLVSGVKLGGTDPETADMMRGEETELQGLMQSVGIKGGQCVYVLPGSHSKIIHTDETGRITDFSTMLTGEMTASLAQNTILRDAVDLSVADTEEEWLQRGCSYTEERGINEALFKVRVLKNILHAAPVQVYSFFMGAVLHAEIMQIVRAGAERIVLGGKRAFRDPMQQLLASRTNAEILCVEDETADNAPALGMIRIFEYKENR